MISKVLYFDFKGVILFVGSISLTNINELLTSVGLVLNCSYLGYQFYKYHKKNKNDKF
jgi:hypothetical protein